MQSLPRLHPQPVAQENTWKQAFLIRRMPLPIIGLLCLFLACQPSRQHEYELGGVGAFSEMINAGVKRMAFSAPMAPADMDGFLELAIQTAAKHQVEIYRESQFEDSDLFPEGIAEGKDVLVLYQGNTLDAYLKWKADKARLIQSKQYNGEARQSIARRLGRLLSYSPRKINHLLADNTAFRTMDDFGIEATNVFLYYKDLDRATEFYETVIGLEMIADYGMATIFRIASDAYLILVDESKGMHRATEPKTVALALLTDQLADWYTYLQSTGTKIKYPYKVNPGGPHDGFVAIDPEGYLLEFETFHLHSENELFIPALDACETIVHPDPNNQTGRDGLGFKAAITWLYYKDVLAMQGFFEDVMGLELVADQGWTKIYQASSTGFIGLVDERRGMHTFTEEKAVTVSFWLEDLQGWYDYVAKQKPFGLRSDSLETGPENKYKAFVGYDPEGYFLEFDRFYEHADNDKLLEYLRLGSGK